MSVETCGSCGLTRGGKVNYSCRDCKNANSREYYRQNSKSIIQQKVEYRKNNVEKIKVTRKKYYDKNAESLRAKGKIWADDNREHLKKYDKQYYLDNKESISHRKRQWKNDNPHKTKARSIVTNAIKRNILPRASSLKCEDCEKQARDYHHWDYDQPLSVISLCRSHHVYRHKNGLECQPPKIDTVLLDTSRTS